MKVIGKHGISQKNIEDLEVMNRMLMRYILGAHSKVQKAFLYLETGDILLGQFISTKRMMSLQNILRRPEREMLRKVYEAQKVLESEEIG